MRNKKVLSFALVLALTVSLLPAAAFASDNTEAPAAAVEETAEQASSEIESENEDISGQESVEEVNSDEDSSEEIAPEAAEIAEEEADSSKDSENANVEAEAVSEEADETNADTDVTDVTGDFEDEGAEAGTSDAEAADSTISVEVNAEEAEVNATDLLANAAENADEQPAYVLMNIPYDEFYEAESGVADTISSATLRGKARNKNLCGASYHQSEEAVTTEGIAGATYPVYVAKLADLKSLGGLEITDDRVISYEMNNHGQVSTVELKGRDSLQEAPNYSYYVLSEEPASYKTLTVTDGKASFSAASGNAETRSEITGQVTLGGRHTYVEIVLDGLEVTPSDVSAVIVTAGENKYAMHHVVNIWRGTELGWNLGDIDLSAGTVITNVRYFLKDGTITDYPAQIKMYAPGWNEVEGGKKYYDLSTRKFFNSEFAVIDGSTYYFDENEMMATGWKKVDGEWYLLKSNGVMAANEWAKDSTGWCWLDASGKITKNKWIQSGGQWYFLKANGYMAANEWAKDSTGWCWLDASGKITKNKWILSGGQWYFLKANGYMAANEWAKDSGGWYWMDASGKITKNKWIKSGGQWYYLKANGYMAANEWARDSGGWYWMDASGKITKNKWIQTGGKWYYLGANGYMVTGTQKIGGKTYKFNSSGVWIK